MKIRDLVIDTDIFLAPLAGYTDLAFRIIAEKMGAKFTFTEMINTKALTRNDEKTYNMLKTDGQREKIGVQIFGNDPKTMNEASKILTEMGRFSVIDINMGCPVPKVVKNGEGSALMKNPSLAQEIVDAVVEGTNIPVTVKIRKGFDKNNINAVEFARKMASYGASSITVHGRTREEYFRGECDKDIIKSVKENVSVPVVANGNIFSLKDKEEMIASTKCDAVMIGRGAIGNPFIFRELDGEIHEISNSDRITTLIEHYSLSYEIGGEASVLPMRKHMNNYLKGMKNSTKLKNHLNKVDDYSDVISTLEEYRKFLTNMV